METTETYLDRVPDTLEEAQEELRVLKRMLNSTLQMLADNAKVNSWLMGVSFKKAA